MGATANVTPLVKPSTNPHAGYRPSADWPNLCAFGIRRVDSPDAMNRAILPQVALRDRVFLHPITWKLHQKVQKYVYPHLTRSLGAHDILFINWAYEQDPPMALALEASDEPYRYCIQRYHRTATRRISAANGCWRSVAATAAEPHTSCAPCIRPPTRGWT
jgi:hypothetical protein